VAADGPHVRAAARMGERFALRDRPEGARSAVASIAAMSRDLDAQLLESVAVRRGRLREALLWGRDRRVRATGDNLRRLAAGVVLAAVVAAGCVGWSFVTHVLIAQTRTPAGVTVSR
jgi:hypothetical protein